MATASRSLATALWGARFASGLICLSYTTSRDTTRRPRLEMGEAVFDGSNRELALHMELRLETPGRKEIAVDPPEPESQDVDEEARPAVATGHARISFQGPGRRLAADDAHGVGGIDGFGQSSQWQ